MSKISPKHYPAKVMRMAEQNGPIHVIAPNGKRAGVVGAPYCYFCSSLD